MSSPRTTGTYVRRALVIGYLFLLVIWPLSLVVLHTFDGGLENMRAALSDPNVVIALQMTVYVAAWAVVLNTVFGVGISLLLVRVEFPGRRLLSALVDLPLSVSPVVVGLALLLAYGSTEGMFGPALKDAGLQVAYAPPGMILATAFISLPLVVREIVPVLQEIGTDQELAAQSLGAGGWQTFWRITLPSIRWAVVYGVVLSLARALGEFGAVKIISGNLIGKTQTATLVVEQKYQDFEQGAAYATSFLLALIAVAAIVVVAILRPSHSTDQENP
ncbi:sulfate ABC transporter permease [Aeromicrobium duanguangcaii]|uniref:Sulfate ABC transporter permease subunit n=1 Tax=Aeromicrobium duanguangcaii TaxID=2968086 RepID=A0ABY5KCQ3_9ACTN|nr:sulfate ABC transporter permease subunit [Aeromicrobium duanguangcaii]MCD9155280.1 sulfate ABC transporter permease subunit [Aeromicrobium duanguangcaii]MCL3838631.1 sulfate ABC transporter permease subunit [Aeromicrobium duanguangcaii]UUI68069.1 sulfate ABC transporter permease subunit [Aeromicrobium duanguangcaii]